MSEPLAGDLADVPTVPWTGPDGTVHEREMDSDRTLCGVVCHGESNSYCAKAACDGCIRAELRRYALRHVCGVDCRMSDEPTTYDLDRRVPQASEGAQMDRKWRLTGRIVDPAEPCIDVALMARVDDGLRRI